MKRLIIVLGIVPLIIQASISPVHAGAKVDRTQPTQGLSISENVLVSTMPPAIYGSNNPRDEHSYMLCQTFEDSVCSAATEINFFNHLVPCLGNVTIDCVKSVWATNSSGNKVIGNFVKYVDDTNPSHYSAIPELGIPEGIGLGGIWDFPGLQNSAGTTTYLLDVALNGRIQGSGPLLTRKIAWGNLGTVLTPVKEIADPNNPNHSLAVSANAEHGLGANGFGQAMNGTCAGHAPSICYQTANFPDNYRFGFSISTTNRFQGWFHGRFFGPDIKISNGKQQEISVEAEPVIVPTLAVSAPTASLPKELADYLFSDRVFGMAGNTIIGSPSGQESFDLASLFLPLAKDTASSSNSFWAFKTLEWNQSMGDVQRCTASDGGLSGVVTTNALVYSAGPPSFNKSSGTLEYKILSPHYQSDGKVAVGTYDLLLRSSVARCIYGFSSAPVKASIEIVSNDGSAQIASTTLVEENGWLKMSAKGFSYSNPTIKVTLTQDAPVASIANRTTAPVVVSEAKPFSKSSTITCTKGKTSKKVTAIKPICPKGYVKK